MTSSDCGYTKDELAQMDEEDANPGPNCVTPWEGHDHAIHYTGAENITIVDSTVVNKKDDDGT